MRHLTWIAALLCSLPLSNVPAWAAYPDKPIRVIVPYEPGGNVDITVRIIAPELSKVLGQSVVVDNRGGAGGRIGAALAARAVPDGYTVLLGSSGVLAVQPAFHDDIEYKPLKDFVYSSLIAVMPNALVVNPALPVLNVKELIALAKARPGTLLMASAGVGSNAHLTGELFQSMANVRFVHVPYKGSGAAHNDLLGGQVNFIFDPITSPVPYIKAGRLRLIAVTSLVRSSLFPDTPTVDESGLRGFESTTDTGLAIPAATPKDAVLRLRNALLVVLDQPQTRQNFGKVGAEVIKSSPDDFPRRLQNDYLKWTRIRKESGINIE